jgi:hypothetical protein
MTFLASFQQNSTERPLSQREGLGGGRDHEDATHFGLVEECTKK